MNTQATTETKLDVPTATRNILMVLQKQPRQYRNFGIWWWRVKPLLRAAFGQAQLYMLGEYVDREGLKLTPDNLSPEDALRAALEEYTMNVRYLMGSDKVRDRDGQPYTIIDQDAAL